jgi:hypothetical protein
MSDDACSSPVKVGEKLESLHERLVRRLRAQPNCSC